MTIKLPRYQLFIGPSGRLLWIAFEDKVEKMYEVVGFDNDSWKLKFITAI